MENRQYEPLNELIGPHIEKHENELPEEIKGRVGNAFSPFHWEDLTPSQRCSLALQHDAQHDPAMAEENAYWFNLGVQIDEVERKIEAFQLMGHQVVPTEAIAQENRINALKNDLEDLKMRWDIPFSKPVSPDAATAFPIETPALPEWIIKAREFADAIAQQQFCSGIRKISARDISRPVARRLEQGELGKPDIYSGTQGPRSEGSVRNRALKGWKFTFPSGTSGINGINNKT